MKLKKQARNYAADHRAQCKAKGGVIVYAMIHSPEAVKAWKELKKIYGSNRDAIEAAIIDCYKQLESP